MNVTSIRAFFDTHVDEWDSQRYTDETYIGRARAALRFVCAAGTSRKVLDLGCGTGHQTVAMISQGQRVVSADFSDAMARATRERILRECPQESPLVVVADATELPFRERTFDTVLALGLVGFVQDRDRLLRGLRAALLPHGELVCDAGVPEHRVLLQLLSRALEAPFNLLRRLWHKLRKQSVPERSTGWYSNNFIKHSPESFEALLRSNGFAPVDRAGSGFGELRVLNVPLLPWRVHCLLTRILNDLITTGRGRFLARHALTYIVRSVSVANTAAAPTRERVKLGRRKHSVLNS